jgi:PqqD family protein of HPr-rel-A system
MPTDTESGVRWRLSETAVAALVERLGDETVLFNPAAWTTHYLNAAASILFDELAAGPRSEDELAVTLGAAYDEPADAPGLRTQVAAALRDLASIDLVAPAERTA